MASGYTTHGLRQIVPKIKATLLNADGEGDTIDVLGEMREIEKGVASLRKGTQVEFDSQQRGRTWKIVVPEPKDKSYNTPQLVDKFSRAMGISLFGTLLTLLKHDVVRLEWQYKKLLAEAHDLDMSLVTAQHEITDGDPEDIGFSKGKGYPRYEEVE